jgi:hypothetical protein
MTSPQDPPVPYWVAQLDAPPAAKSKIAGIIDPPGFSTAPSGPKVRSHSIITCSVPLPKETKAIADLKLSL